MREAYQWVARLSSGHVTVADAQALQRWRQTSPAHRRAYAEANLLWGHLGAAAAESRQQDGQTALASGDLRRATAPWPIGRRAFLGGALAAGAAAASYAVVRPPFQLWPSLDEMSADYRTDVGQRREIALGTDVSVTLNTRTSLSLAHVASATVSSEYRLALISGEVAIATTRSATEPVVVEAANGRAVATNARFNVRLDGSDACVTCTKGDVRVEHNGKELTVRAGEQVVYAPAKLGAVVGIDPEVVTAWEQGLLVFRNDPLSHVIAEINRYRPGKIILVNEELGRRPVLATFRTDRLDDVATRIASVFDARIRMLPGDIVLLG